MEEIGTIKHSLVGMIGDEMSKRLDCLLIVRLNLPDTHLEI